MTDLTARASILSCAPESIDSFLVCAYSTVVEINFLRGFGVALSCYDDLESPLAPLLWSHTRKAPI
jgi:hypothetical protein